MTPVENWVEPPCRHTSYNGECHWCFQWLNSTPTLRQKLADYYRQKYPQWAYRRSSAKTTEEIKQAVLKGLNLTANTTTPIVRQNVIIPAQAARISLPMRTPCKFEGAVKLGCTACNQGYKVRHCEHPDADWDFCAREAKPINHGMNCRECTLYQPQGT